MTLIKTKVIARNVRMSPRKVRLLVDMVKNMDAAKAVIQLRFANKLAAKPVLKLLESAIANAKHNHNIKEETLKVTGGFVDGGTSLKRWMPKAMGRATPVRHRTSHITLMLEGEGSAKGGLATGEEGSTETKEKIAPEMIEKTEKKVVKKTEKKAVKKSAK